jgi:hypothetical protein
MSSNRPMGIVRGMSFEDYHAVQAVSASGLRVFARSPWHYRHRVEIQPTKPMLCGTLAHCAVLEPDAMGQRYVVVPDGAPPRPSVRQWQAKKPSPESIAAMDWWRAFQQQCEGRQIVSAEDYAITKAQVQAVAAVPELAQLLAKGEGEVSIFWIDRASGLYCKARLDWLATDGAQAHILELKSTADESPAAFGRTAARMRYDLQRAHYMAAVEQGTQYGACSWTFAAVTARPPVLAVPYDLTDELIEQAEDDRAELMQRLAWCMENDRWPAYGEGKQLLDFPAYAKRSGEVEVSFVEDESNA